MTVAVGFAPAATPGLITGGSGAAQQDGATEGLFAALLARLDANADATSGDGITAAEFGALIRTLTEQATSPVEEPDADPNVDEAIDETSTAATVDNQLDQPQSTEGKSLLKSLGDALIAINDAVQAGQPIDPALEKKLSDTLDAVAVYLGVVTPPTVVDPRISALASGEGVLPTAPATAPPAAASAPAGSATAQPTQQPPAVAPGLPVDPSQAADAEAVEAAPMAPKSEATTLAEAPEALRQLGLYIGKLADKLAPQDPALAKKLSALADGLKSGTAAKDVATALGLDDAAAKPEVERILAALSATRPATRSVEAKPFTAPTLTLPDSVAAPGGKTGEPAATASIEPAPRRETAEPEIARPAAASTTSARIEKSEPADVKPAPAPATSTQPATPDPTAANSAPTTPQPSIAATARTIHAAYQTPVQQLNLPQVAFEVVRQFEAGSSRFQIRLDPAELGRIDVRLDVDKSGTISARMTVERPETLDLLQRDQRSLQQALQQAGLDSSKTNLEFSLRQNPFAQQGGTGEGRGDQSGFNGRGDTLVGGDDAAAEATTTYRGTASASGLNLFV